MIDEVEIHADYGLRYDDTIKALSACRGKWDPRTGRTVRYVEKIKFAPPTKTIRKT